MAICIVVPTRSDHSIVAEYSRFPLQVVYRPTDGQKLEVMFEYWLDETDSEGPKKRLMHQGIEWQPHRFRYHGSPWEYQPDRRVTKPSKMGYA